MGDGSDAEAAEQRATADGAALPPPPLALPYRATDDDRRAARAARARRKWPPGTTPAVVGLAAFFVAAQGGWQGSRGHIPDGVRFAGTLTLLVSTICYIAVRIEARQRGPYHLKVQMGIAACCAVLTTAATFVDVLGQPFWRVEGRVTRGLIAVAGFVLWFVVARRRATAWLRRQPPSSGAA